MSTALSLAPSYHNKASFPSHNFHYQRQRHPFKWPGVKEQNPDPSLEHQLYKSELQKEEGSHVQGVISMNWNEKREINGYVSLEGKDKNQLVSSWFLQ